MDHVQGGFIAYAIDRERPLALDTGRTKYNRDKASMAACSSQLISDSRSISPEERWQAIAVMAYHLARARGFVGKAVKYWLAAEAKVDAELAIQQSAM